jgi:hypothetical protein
MQVRTKGLSQAIYRHRICRNPVNVNPTTLILLAKLVIPGVYIPEASLYSLIIDYSSDGLAVITINSSYSTLKADISKYTMPPN